jgi:glutamyl-Q tRNA(Asp) synthetase
VSPPNPSQHAFVTRFAPSPTGYLHRGHAFSALTAFDAVRAANGASGGRFILRIEDIDATRRRPEYEAAIYEDLTWLGLTWEQPVRRQSEHMADYGAALRDLSERGLTYRCFRTRREVAEAIEDAPHGAMEAFRGQPLAPDEEAARVEAGEPYAWRLSLEAAAQALGGFGALTFEEHGQGPNGEHGLIQAHPEFGGDVVLARKDVGVAYHLAVPTPAYRHHRLLAGPDGKRYAKRDHAQTLRELRASGMTAAQLRKDLDL